MFAKLAVFALLGVALVSAAPASPGGNGDFNEELVLRNDFSQIIHAFVKNLEDAASRVSGAAKAKIEEFKKIFLELKDQVSAELEQLKVQLTERMNEAKKYGEEKYQEIKEKAKVIFEQKQVEVKNKIYDLQQEVNNHLNGLPHEEPVGH